MNVIPPEINVEAFKQATLLIGEARRLAHFCRMKRNSPESVAGGVLPG